MRIFLAPFRIVIMAVVFLCGTSLIILLAPLPIRRRGIPLSAWPTTVLARFFVKLFGIEYTYPNIDRFHQHSGFVFPNHLSYMDIILLLAIMPVRFLSTITVKRTPILGWAARAVDTVFVDRSDQESRDRARDALSQIKTFPPVVIFPEGGIIPPSHILKPFRYGAFEIATQGEIPIIPCILRYDPVDLIFWRYTPIWTMLWRLATYPRPLRVELVALRTIRPHADDDPEQMALETHGAMNAVLGRKGRLQDGL